MISDKSLIEIAMMSSDGHRVATLPDAATMAMIKAIEGGYTLLPDGKKERLSSGRAREMARLYLLNRGLGWDCNEQVEGQKLLPAKIWR